MFKTYFWEHDDEDYRGDDSRFCGMVSVSPMPFGSYRQLSDNELEPFQEKKAAVARKDPRLGKGFYR